MKNFLFLSALFFLVISCSDESIVQEQVSNVNQKKPSVTSSRFACTPQIIDINAGQNYLSGNITISNSSDFVFVTYNANTNWFFKELHLYVGPLSKVPQSNGNPRPGRFSYKIRFNNLASTYTFKVPLADVVKDANGCFIVAAHSSTVRTNANGGIVQSETGWAGYNNFSGGNWARYFDYCVCSAPVID